MRWLHDFWLARFSRNAFFPISLIFVILNHGAKYFSFGEFDENVFGVHVVTEKFSNMLLFSTLVKIHFLLL